MNLLPQLTMKIKPFYNVQWLADSQHIQVSELLRSMLKKQLKEEVLTFCFQEYVKGNMTLLKIAEITKIPLLDILFEARNRKILFQYSLEDLTEDIETINKITTHRSH